MVDFGVVVYAAAVAVGGPAIARRPPLHTRGGRRARRCRRRRFLRFGLLVAAALFCSSDVAFGAHGIEIGRPPRPDRVAGAVGITSKRASVQWQPGRTRIGRARSRRPGRPATLTAGRTDPIHVYRNSSTGPFWTREAAQALPGR